MTNLELIKASLKLAQVLSEGDEPTNEQAVDGLASLNDLFSEWESNSIDIGHYPQTSLAATSPIYADAVLAAKYNLAISFCADYEKEPSRVVMAIAANSYGRLQRESIVAQQIGVDMTHLPGTVERENIETGE